MRKAVSSSHNSVAQVLSETNTEKYYRTWVLYGYFSFCVTQLKVQNLIKVVILTASAGTFLNETGSFLSTASTWQ